MDEARSPPCGNLYALHLKKSAQYTHMCVYVSMYFYVLFWDWYVFQYPSQKAHLLIPSLIINKSYYISFVP